MKTHAMLVARRWAVGGLAGVMAIAGTFAGGPATNVVVRAGDPAIVIPSDAELADAASATLKTTPPTLPDAIDADALIEAANSAVDALPAEAWEVEALAATLSDPEAAFSLVRDSIRYEPYVGVLRGAEGTLAARAGNAYDRALLLKALLDQMGRTTRFAFADLDPATAAAVVARTFDEPAAPLPGSDVPTLDPKLMQAVGDRGRRDYALLRQALGDQLGVEVTDAGGDAVAVATHHAWVQIEHDGQWIDEDPTMADAVPGQALVPASRTLDAIPDAERQSVVVRVIAETLQDGAVSQAVALERYLDAAAAADNQIVLSFEPADSGGGGLLGGVGAPTAYVPVLSTDGVPDGGTAFSVAGTVDGGFGGFGGGSPVDLTGLLIEVEVDVPGRPPSVRDRLLVDRIPTELRAAGSVTADQLLPLPAQDGKPLALMGVHHLMISTGGASPRAQAISRSWTTYLATTELIGPAAQDYSLGTVVAPLTVADQGLVLASEREIVPAVAGSPDIRAFVARSRAYLVSLGPDPGIPDQVVERSDLLIDSVDVLLRDGADPKDAAVRQLWYGALQAALETELTVRRAVAFEPASVAMMAVSLEMSQPLTVIAAADSVPEGAALALRRAVEHGLIVVVPGDPATAVTWWTISGSGATRSILDPGLGGGRIGGRPLGPPRIPGGPKQPPRQPPGPKPPPRVPKDVFEPAKKVPACVPRDNENTCPAERAIPWATIIGGLVIAGTVIIILVVAYS